MWQLASIQGSAPIRADSRSFIEAFRRRVEAGLLIGRRDRRSNYVVRRSGPVDLVFGAVDWLTAFNVGLNEVALDASTPGRVLYAVRYPRWAGYAVGLGAGLGVILAVFFSTIDLRRYIAGQPPGAFLWLPVEQAVVLSWILMLFWCFAWPWILIALHRGPLRRLLERIIGEVDAEATTRSVRTA